MPAGRKKTIGGVFGLLGAFLAASMTLGLLLSGLFLPLVSGAGMMANAGVQAFESLPSDFTFDPLAQQSRILAADGTVIATPQIENRVVVPLNEVAPIMRRAQVAIEDHRFYEHGGVDMQGIMRALFSNLSSGGSQGASTITQQFVKLSLQQQATDRGDTEGARAAVEKNYMRKLKELKYAVALEHKMSKDQILQGYLNIAYYGDGSYGVQAAALHYFSVPASKLTLTQAATLAGLVQNPSTTDPVNFPKRAQDRRNTVLERMHSLGIITDKQYTTAIARPLAKDMRVSEPRGNCAASPYPYYCDFITNWLLEQPNLGKTRKDRLNLLKRGGITVQTTLDTRIQRLTQDSINAQVPIGNKSKVGAAAFVAEPGTGKVLAFAQNTKYGNGGWGNTQINWAVNTEYGGSMGFQFGSTAKAFSLLTAMESGMTTRSTVNAAAAGDTPHTYQPDEFGDTCGPGGPWQVTNDTSFRGGPISLMQATALSTNTAFVALAQEVGTCNVRDTATRLGLTQANGEPIGHYAPEIILGSDEVAPQSVANAYATLAAGGQRCDMYPVTQVIQNKKVIWQPKPKCEQVADPDAVAAVDQFLMYNMTNGSGQMNQLRGRESAGKTGTSNKSNESWFAGYTPQLSVAVWVGTPDDGDKRWMKNITLGGKYCAKMHGACFAAPIWKNIMNGALAGKPAIDFPRPTTTYNPPPPRIVVRPAPTETPTAPTVPPTNAPSTPAATATPTPNVTKPGGKPTKPPST